MKEGDDDGAAAPRPGGGGEGSCDPTTGSAGSYACRPDGTRAQGVCGGRVGDGSIRTAVGCCIMSPRYLMNCAIQIQIANLLRLSAGCDLKVSTKTIY